MNTETWIDWPQRDGAHAAYAGPDLLRIRLAVFRSVMLLCTVLLSAVLGRSYFVTDTRPAADFANLLLVLASFAAVTYRPIWYRGLAWIVLVAFSLNIADSLLPSEQVLVPTHVFLPLLALWGALLGMRALSIAGMGISSTFLAGTWYAHAPLSGSEFVSVTNLMMATAFVGAACMALWVQYDRMQRGLAVQQEHLYTELEQRMQLLGVVTHDVRNPLTAIAGLIDLAEDAKEMPLDDVARLGELVTRMTSIVDSAQRMDGAGAGHGIQAARTSAEELYHAVTPIVAHQLKKKGQTLILHEGGHVHLRTDRELVVQSLLANFVVNASKFSPRGAILKLWAAPHRDGARIVVSDCGNGFPSTVLTWQDGRTPMSRGTGTDGEQGTGLGLRIASLCATRLGGRIQLRNTAEGADAAIWLPLRPYAMLQHDEAR